MLLFCKASPLKQNVYPCRQYKERHENQKSTSGYFSPELLLNEETHRVTKGEVKAGKSKEKNNPLMMLQLRKCSEVKEAPTPKLQPSVINPLYPAATFLIV